MARRRDSSFRSCEFWIIRRGKRSINRSRVYDPSRRHAYEHLGEVCTTLDAAMGTGGGNVPIVLESNQNHAIVKDTEVCPCLPASMGMGGGYVQMVVSDKEPIAVEDDITIKIDDSGVSYSIRAREHKGAQCVVVRSKVK